MFSIEAGNEATDLFHIDANTGMMSTVGKLDYESKRHHQLRVRATGQKSLQKQKPVLLLQSHRLTVLHSVTLNLPQPHFLQRDEQRRQLRARPRSSDRDDRGGGPTPKQRGKYAIVLQGRNPNRRGVTLTRRSVMAAGE